LAEQADEHNSAPTQGDILAIQQSEDQVSDCVILSNFP
jgi:hypothetical protein